MNNTKTNLAIRKLCEGALMIAMAEILSFLPLYKMPWGGSIDLAMLPIDPRQGTDGFRGAAYLLEHADIRRCLPMHQWEDFDFTNRFLAAYPQFAENIIPVTHTGQQIIFSSQEVFP